MIPQIARFFRLSRRELIVLVAVFLVSVPAITPRLYSSDEVEYYSYLRSIWFDHDVSFENEYRYFYDHDIAQSGGFHETFLELQTEAGRRINFATLGCAILWAPFYAVADAAVHLMRDLGREVPADGFSQPYIASVAFASALYGFLAILLSIRAARIVTGEGLLSGIAVWFGTPLLFYMYVAPPMSHASSAFAVALFVSAWLHARETWTPRRVFVLGLCAALMTMVREQDVFFAFGPAMDFVLTAMQTTALRRHEAGGRRQETGDRRQETGDGRQEAGDRGRDPGGIRRWLVSGATGVAAFGLGYLPQLIAYNALNGHPWPSRLVTRKMMWTAPHALQVLASPEHGFLFWTPLAALGIAGLIVMVTDRGPDGRRDGRIALLRLRDVRATRLQPSDRRRIGWCALLMVALQIYVSGSVESWTVAGAFGQRRFVALTVLLTLGLAALETASATFLRSAWWKRVAGPVCMAVCVWWNVALIAEFGLGLMDRQRLEPRRNAHDAFVTIPRLAPQLAYRYLVDRKSFYRHREGTR